MSAGNIALEEFSKACFFDARYVVFELNICL